MPDVGLEIALLMRSLRALSFPQTRAADHFLLRDLNEIYSFAVSNPDAVRPARVRAKGVDARMRGHDGVELNGLRSVGHDGVDARVRA